MTQLQKVSGEIIPRIFVARLAPKARNIPGKASSSWYGTTRGCTVHQSIDIFFVRVTNIVRKNGRVLTLRSYRVTTLRLLIPSLRRVVNLCYLGIPSFFDKHGS